MGGQVRSCEMKHQLVGKVRNLRHSRMGCGGKEGSEGATRSFPMAAGSSGGVDPTTGEVVATVPTICAASCPWVVTPGAGLRSTADRGVTVVVKREGRLDATRGV